jgi:hypothetical protein
MASKRETPGSARMTSEGPLWRDQSRKTREYRGHRPAAAKPRPARLTFLLSRRDKERPTAIALQPTGVVHLRSRMPLSGLTVRRGRHEICQ